MSQSREKLIKQLQTLPRRDDDLDQDYLDYGMIADFILADRKRVVEPLVITKEICMRPENIGHHAKQKVLLTIAIDETLKNAGAL